MNELNHEVFEKIKEWVETGEWKKVKNYYDKKRKAYNCTFTSPWFIDLTDEEYENIDWDNYETDYFTFHLSIYIWKDNTFKIEFDPGLFHLMYKGYDEEADRNAWEEFKDLAKQKGLLLEESE